MGRLSCDSGMAGGVRPTVVCSFLNFELVSFFLDLIFPVNSTFFLGGQGKNELSTRILLFAGLFFNDSSAIVARKLVDFSFLLFVY